MQDHVTWIKHIQDTDFFVAGDKTILAEALHPKNEKVDLPFSVALAKLPAGEASLPHSLAQSELYLFIAGEGEVIAGAERHRVQKNSLWLVAANQEQYVRNTGNSDLIFYCIVTPPWTEKGEQIISQ